MKSGRNRTMSICLTDLPKERFTKASNGKIYVNLSTYDYDEPDRYDNDFSVSMSRNKEELERIKNGEKLDRIFVGNGRIWEDKVQKPTEEEKSELGF